jgi:peptidylprolyl isomerase
VRALTLALCLAVAIAGCGGDDSSTTGGDSAEAGELSKPKIEVPKGAPPKELEIEDLVEGSGDEAQAGDEVAVDYVGVLYKSGEQFDASWDRGESFSFKLGSGSVIQGWDQGLVGMKVGGRRELVIPPELAYGPGGSPPTIPPNETLIFVIDLLEVR